MARKKKKVNLDKYRQTRGRIVIGGIRPATKIVPNKKAKESKEACRSKVGEE